MNTPDRHLPLAPLHIVLFPSRLLPIRIFEERYKAMLRACLDSDSRFGMVLIMEEQETGAPAVPYEVGTIARICRVTPMDQGQFNLLAMGERRFLILHERGQAGLEPGNPIVSGHLRRFSSPAGHRWNHSHGPGLDNAEVFH